MKKRFSIVLICILFSCSFVICPNGVFVTGSSVSKLPTPELVSVTYNDYSYTVPASTSTDPFTGKTIENPAYRIENRTLTFVINKKNIDLNTYSHTYYIVRMKGVFSNEWSNNITGWVKPDVNSPLTTVVVTLPSSDYYPFGSKVDFQVVAEALDYVSAQGGGPPISSGLVEKVIAVSDWSNIKTVTLGSLGDGAQNQPELNPSQTPPSIDQLEPPVVTVLLGFSLLELVLVATLCTVIAVIATIVFMHKRKGFKNSS